LGGFVAGLVIGLAIGIALGTKRKPQKPWSELTEKEKRTRTGIMVTLLAALVAGVVALLLAR